MVQLYVVDGSTVTILLQVTWHPFNVVVNVSVRVPEAPAVTFTDEPVADPTIEPFPAIDQLYELIFAGAAY